jgi:uncharacterized protein (DUF1778 family)
MTQPVGRHLDRRRRARIQLRAGADTSKTLANAAAVTAAAGANS